MQNCQHTVKVKSLCFRAELAQAAMPPLDDVFLLDTAASFLSGKQRRDK